MLEPAEHSFGDDLTKTPSVMSPRHDVISFGVELPQRALVQGVFDHDVSLSETELRAAHPNLHSGRLRPLLQVAARFATSQAKRNIK